MLLHKWYNYLNLWPRHYLIAPWRFRLDCEEVAYLFLFYHLYDLFL